MLEIFVALHDGVIMLLVLSKVASYLVLTMACQINMTLE